MSEIELRDQILRHSLQILRATAGEQAVVDEILRQLEKDLRKLLESQTLSGAQKRQVEALIRDADEIIEPAYARVAKSFDARTLAVIVAEKTVDTMGDVFPLDVSMPTQETLNSLSRDVMIDGAPSSAWWERQSQDTAFKFAAEVRQGVINGETNERIVQRIVGKGGEPGIMEVQRRHARTLVHSSVMTAANEARLATFRKNARLISGVRWLSTLDSATCWTAETLVLMADGSERPIAEIREGDVVLGGVSGEPRRVIATMKSVAQSSVIIHCDGHYVGRATEDHPILTPTGWREAGSLAVSADVSEREVLCRHLEAAERPLSGAPQARGSEPAPCGEPSVAEARRSDNDNHRQGDELRDGPCDGDGADRATEYEGAERLQHDGRWRRDGGARSLGSVAHEDNRPQSGASGRSGIPGDEPGSDLAPLERSGTAREDERGSRSGSGEASREQSGLGEGASDEDGGGNASQVAGPGIPGEDGVAQAAYRAAGLSQTSGGEALGDHEGAPFGVGPQVLGNPEGVATRELTGRIEAGPVEVYNLTVEGDPTYVAGGIIVHNCIVCAALDGKGWDLDGEPLKGTKVAFEAPPKHFACRCILSPIPKTFKDLGLNIPEPKLAPIRASSDGPTDATSFDEFLKRQSPAFVDEVLGKERAAMFRARKITLSDLVSGTGRELTLNELRGMK